MEGRAEGVRGGAQDGGRGSLDCVLSEGIRELRRLWIP